MSGRPSRGRLAVVAVGLAVFLAACTGAGGSGTEASPTVAGTAGLPDRTAMCRDLGLATSLVSGLLERIESGEEGPDQFTADANQVDLLARQLYTDAAPFATGAGKPAFRLLTTLSTDMLHLLTREFQEFKVTDPSDIDPAAIAGVRGDLEQVDRAVAQGVLPCAPAG